MSDSTNVLIGDIINYISIQVNRYIILFVFLFGTTGNLLNIIVFSQSVLRTNPCVLYFLGSSTAGLAIILIGLPTHILAGWISTDPTNTNSLLCKLRIYLLYSCRTTSIWLLVFATIDRYFRSSMKIYQRRLSSYRIACNSIFIIIALSFILWAETLFCYDANVTDAPIKCYGKSNSCRIYNDIVYAISTVIIPSILMLTFGLLTIRNINRSYRTSQSSLINTTMINHSRRKKRKSVRRSESSLTRMLLLQVILITFCSIPQAIHQFYLTLTINVNKQPIRIAIENFIVNFNFSLTYIGNGISFYIYTLNGTVFRQTLVRIIDSVSIQMKFYFNWFLAQLIMLLLTVYSQR